LWTIFAWLIVTVVAEIGCDDGEIRRRGDLLQIRRQRREIDHMGGTAGRVVYDGVEVDEWVVTGGILIAFFGLLRAVGIDSDGLAAGRTLPVRIISHVFHVSFP